MIRFIFIILLGLPLFALETIHLQLQWYDQFQFAGYYIAKEKGFYEKAGLDVHLRPFSAKTNVVHEVLSNEAQYGIGRSSLILNHSKKEKVIALAAIFQTSPMVLLSLKNKALKDVKEGKHTVFMAGDIAKSAEFKLMILNEAIKLNQIKIIENSGNIEDLINHKTDFMLAYISNEPYLLEQRGIPYNIIFPKDQGVNFYSDILFTSPKEIKSHPRRVQKFLEASLKGWEYAFANIPEAVEIIYHHYNSQNKSKEALLFEAKQLKKLAYDKSNTHIGEINPKKFQQIYNLYKILGFIKQDFNINEMLLQHEPLQLTPHEITLLKELQNRTLKISNDTNWPPYNYNEYGLAKGFSIDYMNLLAHTLNLNIQYVTHDNWYTFINKMDDKDIDIILNIVKTPQRSKQMAFTAEYATTTPSIFVHNGNATIKTLQDLNHKIVSLPKGFHYIELIQEYYPNIQIITTESTLDSIKDVQFRRADATLASLPVANFLMHYHGINNIKAINTLNDKRFITQLSIGVRKDIPGLDTLLNKAMQHLDDKKVLALRKKWFKNSENQYIQKNIHFTKEERKFIESLHKINVCVDPDWEPYEFLKQGKYSGLSSDYLNYISNIINIPIQLIPSKSFDQSLYYAQEKKCDVLPLTAITIERLNYLNFTKPYLHIPIVIATNEKTNYIEDIDSIKNQYFGIVKGYATAEILRKKHPHLKIKEYSSIKEGLKAVKKKEIYGFIDTALTISTAFSKYQMHNLKIAGELKRTYDLSMAIRNDYPELLSIFQKALSSMSQQEKNEIHQKWLSINYEKVLDYSLIVSIILPIIFFFIIIIFYLWNIKLKNEIRKKIHIEKKLNTSIDDFKMLVNSTLEALFILSHTGHITQVNNEAKKLFKFKKKADYLGKHILSFISMMDKDYVIEQIRHHKSLPHEITFVKNDGSSFPGLVKGENLITTKQAIRVVSIVDLTDLKQKEHLLYQQSKMALMGEMMSAIAHQWRQPLNALAALNMQVEMKLEIQGNIQEKEYQPISDSINKQLSYMSKTIDDFRDFFIPNKEKTLFDVCQAIYDVHEIVKPQFNTKNIQITIKAEETYILGFPNEFKQVIINILNNAKDAIIENKIPEGKIVIKIVKLNSRIKILIKDNGGGIPPEVISKIFNPYFTTKFESKGTGIGLYMSKMIIEQSMKGELNVKSHKNHTLFTIII